MERMITVRCKLMTPDQRAPVEPGLHGGQAMNAHETISDHFGGVPLELSFARRSHVHNGRRLTAVANTQNQHGVVRQD